MPKERSAMVTADFPAREAPRSALQPRAVIFDMDGLLLNTEILARRALRLAGAELGIDLPESLCDQMIGVPADACRTLLQQCYGENCAADALLAASTRYLHAQIAAGGMRRMPGVTELLAYLRDERVPRAVATSSARDKAKLHLSSAGLCDAFDIIVTRTDVARGKPFPDLYLDSARRLGFAPNECLALEDSYNGVRAAHAAGMPVIMVPDLLLPTPEMQQMCLLIVGNLHAVLGRLRCWRPRPPAEFAQLGKRHA